MPRRCSNLPLIASTGLLDALVSKYARLAAHLRDNVLPKIASFFKPFSTPTLIRLISLSILFLPSPASGSS